MARTEAHIKIATGGGGSICNTLPATSGATTIFTSGDDKDTGHGRGVNFFKLSQNNPYGNNLRFTGTTGTAAIQADGIMLDWNHDNGSTVHGWSTTDVSSGGVVSDIAACAALTIGGLSEWLLPNIKELGTLINYGLSSKFNWSPLSITPLILKSSTFDPNDSAKAFTVASTSGSTGSENIAFGAPRRFLPFRYITYAELGITGAVYPIVGAKIMKTNQTVSYRTGDDGDLQKGRATDFLTLPSNNPFGTTARFTDELGGSTYANDIVIDWSTYDGTEVLGWYRNILNVDTTWNDAIDDAASTSVGSFTSGWFLPNAIQLVSIANFGTTSALQYVPFNYNSSTLLLSSTTRSNVTSQCYLLTNSDKTIAITSKTSSSIRRYIAARNFTVTGTTLT
tara:strand:- start:442 stop:1626 length:1185 start_codon:yes stop_codon:yes gene_type:complete